MRKSQRCPKCDGRKLWRMASVFERGNDTLSPLALTYQKSAGGAYQNVGWFEAWICHACGYTEWYANERDKLKEDPAAGISLVDGNKRGPRGQGPR